MAEVRKDRLAKQERADLCFPLLPLPPPTYDD